MDEIKPQIDSISSSEAEKSSADFGPKSAADQNSAVSQNAEDSRDIDLKKAQAEQNPVPATEVASGPSVSWVSQLKRFQQVVHAALEAKENVNLLALDSKVPSEFQTEWTLDTKRFLILAVNLRHRQEARRRAPSHKPQKVA